MSTKTWVYRRIAVSLAVVFAVSSIPSISLAQNITPPSVVSGISSSLQEGSDTVTDIFVGKGTRGPYSLNWKQIDEDSEAVVMNGVKLRKGQDYNIDYKGGVVAFMQALSNGTIARVTYRYTRGKAVQNNASISIPLNLTLMQKTGRSLGITGLLKQGDGTSANPGASVFGLNMATGIGSISKLTSQFMMSSQDDTGNGEKGDFWDRAAMNLGNEAKYGDLQVKTSFIRTGQNFAGAKEYNLKAGDQLLDLSAAYNAGSTVSAFMSMKETDRVGGADKGVSNSLLEQRIVFSLPKAPKMSLTRNVSEKESTTGEVTQRSEVSKLLLEQNFGKTTSASAFMETAEVKNGASEDTIRTSQINFNVTPTAKVNFASQLVLRDSEQQGESTSINMNMNAAPSKNVKVALGFSQLDAQNQHTSQNTNLLITALAAPGVNVEATYNLKSVDVQGDVTTAGMKVNAAVNPNMSIKTSLMNRDSTNAGSEQNRDISLETKPLNNVNLSLGLGKKETLGQSDTSRNLRMELKPYSHTTIGTGYRYVENGAMDTTIQDYTLKTKPVSFLEFSGFYKTRDVTGVADLDTMALQWKLDPVAWFKLNGQYTRNPEDANSGAVLRYDTRTFGVETTLGILSLRGGYTSKDEYTIGREAIEKTLGLSVKMFGHGRLTTDMKIADLLQAVDTSTVTYTLGYSHNVGSDFSLSLSGRMTQYEQEQVMLKDQTEYQANLKVGVHF